MAAPGTFEIVDDSEIDVDSEDAPKPKETKERKKEMTGGSRKNKRTQSNEDDF